MVIGILQEQTNCIERVRNHVRKAINKTPADQNLFSRKITVQAFSQGLHIEQLFQLFVLFTIIFALSPWWLLHPISLLLIDFVTLAFINKLEFESEQIAADAIIAIESSI